MYQSTNWTRENKKYVRISKRKGKHISKEFLENESYWSETEIDDNDSISLNNEITNKENLNENTNLNKNKVKSDMINEKKESNIDKDKESTSLNNKENSKSEIKSFKLEKPPQKTYVGKKYKYKHKGGNLKKIKTSNKEFLFNEDIPSINNTSKDTSNKDNFPNSDSIELFLKEPLSFQDIFNELDKNKWLETVKDELKNVEELNVCKY